MYRFFKLLASLGKLSPGLHFIHQSFQIWLRLKILHSNRIYVFGLQSDRLRFRRYRTCKRFLFFYFVFFDKFCSFVSPNRFTLHTHESSINSVSSVNFDDIIGFVAFADLLFAECFFDMFTRFHQLRSLYLSRGVFYQLCFKCKIALL
jgi:hypothetical protein